MPLIMDQRTDTLNRVMRLYSEVLPSHEEQVYGGWPFLREKTILQGSLCIQN